MEKIELPSLCVVMNIVEKLQEKLRLEQFSLFRNWISRSYRLYRSDEEYIVAKQSLLLDLASNNMVLSYVDSIIVAEYIYHSIIIHGRKEFTENPSYLLDSFKSTMKMSETSIFDCSRGIMGFTWSSSGNSYFFEFLICDHNLSQIDDIFGKEFIYNCDLYTFYKLIQKAYAAKAREFFCRCAEQRRGRFLLFEVAPEIADDYISRSKTTQGDWNSIDFYRGIIEGTE